MEMRQALKEQYHAGLAMLAECVEKCPEAMWEESWLAGEDPRTYWSIAYHAAFYAHLYMDQNEDAFQPWPGLRAETEVHGKHEILEYIRFIDKLIDPIVDQLDLDSDETGFSWYPNMSKLSHQIMSLRHLQGHVGQLSELLMAKGIDTDWISKSDGLSRC
jgi:choline dehydrogenase-like flavoprotein